MHIFVQKRQFLLTLETIDNFLAKLLNFQDM